MRRGMACLRSTSRPSWSLPSKAGTTSCGGMPVIYLQLLCVLLTVVQHGGQYCHLERLARVTSIVALQGKPSHCHVTLSIVMVSQV